MAMATDQETTIEARMGRLRATVDTLLLPELWRQVIVPYLGRIHMHVWLLHDSTRSSPTIVDRLLSDTFTLALEELVGIEYWQTVMRPALIAHGAMITGSWPLQVISGVEFADSTDVDIVFPYRNTKDSVSRLYEQLNGGRSDRRYDRHYDFHYDSADGHVGGPNELKWYYNVKGVIGVQQFTPKFVNQNAPCRKTFELVEVRNATDEPDTLAHNDVDIRRWIETQFDFDCCSTVVDVSNTERPVTISSRTTLNRLVTLQSSFRFVGDPAVAWDRYQRYRRRGVRFDPIDRSDIERQWNTFLSTTIDQPLTIQDQDKSPYYIRVIDHHDDTYSPQSLNDWKRLMLARGRYSSLVWCDWVNDNAPDAAPDSVVGDKRHRSAPPMSRRRFRLILPAWRRNVPERLELGNCHDQNSDVDSAQSDDHPHCFHSILYPRHLHIVQDTDTLIVLLCVNDDTQMDANSSNESSNVEGHPSSPKRTRLLTT